MRYVRLGILVGLAAIGQPIPMSAQQAAAASRSGSERQAGPDWRIPAPLVSGVQWIPGVHYRFIITGQPETIPAEQVQLMEFSHYRGPASLRERADFRQWLESKRNRVKFVHMPWVTSPHTRLEAQMYYTLEALGRGDLHTKLREWIVDREEPQRYWTYAEHWYPNERAIFRYNLEFALANGINEHRFADIYRSETISDRVLDAERKTRGFVGGEGTPTYVVNQRYSVSAYRVRRSKPRTDEDDYKQFIAVLDYLINSELQGTHQTIAEWHRWGVR